MQHRFDFGGDGMRLCILGSGSGGNVVVIESGGRRLVVDAGFSCKEIERRMREVHLEPARFDGLIVTHEHGDHVRGAEVFARKHDLTVYATQGTFDGTTWQRQAPRTQTIRSGHPVEVGSFQVEPFTLPHDAREPVGFVVEDGAGHRVGLIADLGSQSQLAWARLHDVDVLLMETNHDLTMLREGPYPWSLKQRVAGAHGHLSNAQAAEGLPELLTDRLRYVVLYHLSRTNNLPGIAQTEIGEVLVREGSSAQMVMTNQFEPTDWLAVP